VSALQLSMLNRPGVTDAFSLGGVTLNEVRFIGIMEPLALLDMYFAHLDVRGADCAEISFENVRIGALTVDDDSRFGVGYPQSVTALQIESQGDIVTVRDPAKIAQWIFQHLLLPQDRIRELPLVKYFDRLCRKFLRQHQIRAHSTDEAYFLLQDPFWAEVRRILGPRLHEEVRAAQGPRNLFFRLERPDALINPADDDEESKEIRTKIIIRAAELLAAIEDSQARDH
jgi:hypothetical protein